MTEQPAMLARVSDGRRPRTQRGDATETCNRRSGRSIPDSNEAHARRLKRAHRQLRPRGSRRPTAASLSTWTGRQHHDLPERSTSGVSSRDTPCIAMPASELRGLCMNPPPDLT